MPTAPDDPGAPPHPDELLAAIGGPEIADTVAVEPTGRTGTTAQRTTGTTTRIAFTTEGPALVSGPVEMTTADGRVIRSDRFLVALCLCKRSGTYPLCDTSHRRRRRS